jgi:ABC-2 type transport system ATP-binding protein
MSEWIVETRGLTKCYRRGRPPAVDGLNLQVPPGSLFGFIGPNGAGKTTTLRMLAGLLEPTTGAILIDGVSLQHDPDAVHHRIGYMPDFIGLYTEMTSWQYLDFFARCHDLPAQRRQAMVTELLDLVGLADHRDDDIAHLSRGMQQRLCLAQALVHDPKVLLLDEPASGLDPRARVEMRELLRELVAMGKTIIVSSHVLSDLAEVCDRVGILGQGHLITSGPLAELRQQMRPGRMLRLHIFSAAEQALALLAAYPGVTNPVQLDGDETGGFWLEAYLAGEPRSAADLLHHLVQNGVVVAEYRQAGNELEELFLQLTAAEAA